MAEALSSSAPRLPCFCWRCNVEAEMIREVGTSQFHQCPVCKVAIHIDEDAFYSDPLLNLNQELDNASLHISPTFSRRSTLTSSDIEENLEDIDTSPSDSHLLTVPPTPLVPTNTPVATVEGNVPEEPQYVDTKFADVANFLLNVPTPRKRASVLSAFLRPDYGEASGLARQSAEAVSPLAVVQELAETPHRETDSFDEPGKSSVSEEMSTKPSSDEPEVRAAPDTGSLEREWYSRAETHSDESQGNTSSSNIAQPTISLPVASVESVHPKENLQVASGQGASSEQIESASPCENKSEEASSTENKHESVPKSPDPDVSMCTSLRANESRKESDNFLHVSRNEPGGNSSLVEYSPLQQDGSSMKRRTQSRFPSKIGIPVSSAMPEGISTPPFSSGIFVVNETSTPLSTPRPDPLIAFRTSQNLTVDTSEISMMKSDDSQTHPNKSTSGDCSGKSMSSPKREPLKSPPPSTSGDCSGKSVSSPKRKPLKPPSRPIDIPQNVQQDGGQGACGEPLPRYGHVPKDGIPSSGSSSPDVESRADTIYPVVALDVSPTHSYNENLLIDGTSIEDRSQFTEGDELNMAMFATGINLTDNLSTTKTSDTGRASTPKVNEQAKSLLEHCMTDVIKKLRAQKTASPTDKSVQAKSLPAVEAKDQPETNMDKPSTSGTLPTQNGVDKQS